MASRFLSVVTRSSAATANHCNGQPDLVSIIDVPLGSGGGKKASLLFGNNIIYKFFNDIEVLCFT